MFFEKFIHKIFIANTCHIKVHSKIREKSVIYDNGKGKVYVFLTRYQEKECKLKTYYDAQHKISSFLLKEIISFSKK